MAHQLSLDASGTEPQEPDEWQLEVASVLEGSTHISGIGWKVIAPDGTSTLGTETRRYGRTLVFSQFAALRRGFEEALRLGARRLLVRLPDRRVVSLLRGERMPRLRRAEAAAEGVAPFLRRFASVRFDVEHPPDPDLTHAVGEALDVGLHAAAERAEHRVHVMEQIMERARSVVLERRNGGWVANGRYRVQLSPMRCECPAWTARWRNAPIAGRRALRLPCKHLVALAVQEGITVPADLAELARRALP